MEEQPKDPINYQIDWARFAELVNNAKSMQFDFQNKQPLSPEEQITKVRDQLLQEFDNAEDLVRWMAEFKEADELIERVKNKK